MAYCQKGNGLSEGDRNQVAKDMTMMRKISLAVMAATVAMPALAADPIWDPNTVMLESQQLAEGVYAVVPVGAAEMAAKGQPIATTGGFVVGENGVLVIETMLNERLYTQMMGLVAAVTDKPVRYVVNTSYHGDHSYGNSLVPEEVVIIQHATTATYVAEHFEADTQFMMQNFGSDSGIAEAKPVAADLLVPAGGSLAVDLGGIKVDLVDHGFAQTGGDLFVSVPSAKALWSGNAVISQGPALPWLLDGHLTETLATLSGLQAAYPADTVLVPGHGPVTDMAAVQWSVAYLTALRDGVKASVEAGATLEETVAAVQLPEYQGYAIFGWIHPAVNVPAAYAELK
jgi:glyoxylase-like metal-dependent hydrolase (beta-lactamase superfamily II)